MLSERPTLVLRGLDAPGSLRGGGCLLRACAEGLIATPNAAETALTTSESGLSKRTPWSRLCRATGGAPLGG